MTSKVIELIILHLVSIVKCLYYVFMIQGRYRIRCGALELNYQILKHFQDSQEPRHVS